MGKMVPLHQTMKIERLVREVRVGGLVTKSNFLTEDKHHILPLEEDLFDKLSEGDTLRMTFFAKEEDIKETPGRMTFKSKGVRYEVWNKENEGWDKIFEEFA